MKKKILLLTPVLLTVLACERNTEPEVIAPASYTFERDGANTVFYDGQSERLAMGGEFGSALKEVLGSHARWAFLSPGSFF